MERKPIYFTTVFHIKIDLFNWNIIPFKNGDRLQTIYRFLCFTITIERDIKINLHKQKKNDELAKVYTKPLDSQSYL